MLLTVTGLTFTYSSISVLNDVTYSLDTGGCTAILGCNGAGKSTLLRCIDRILRPTAGQILLNGTDLSSMRPSDLARAISYVPQKPEFSGTTVFDAVLMGRLPHCHFEASERDYEVTETLLTQFSLEHLALRSVNEISGGEMQKVAIARALAQEPQLLLFDEPTSNLDLKNQLEVTDLLRSLTASRSLSALVTMHDLNLALRMADRFLLLKDHTILAAGGKEVITPETIQSVYDIPVTVEHYNGRLAVLPL